MNIDVDMNLNCKNLGEVEQLLQKLEAFKTSCQESKEGEKTERKEKKIYESIIFPKAEKRRSFVNRLAQSKSALTEFRRSIYMKPKKRKEIKEAQIIPTPKELKSCVLYQQILDSPCNLSFDRKDYQLEYEKIAGTQSWTFPGYNGKLELSILNSVITSLIESSEHVCIGGNINIWLVKNVKEVDLVYGKKNKKHFREEIFTVIPQATQFHLIKNISCKKPMYYFPLTINWVNPSEKALVEEKKKEMECQQCTLQPQAQPQARGVVKICKNVCIGSHAMAVFVDTNPKGGIFVYEPNSIRSPWFTPVALEVEKLLQTIPLFSSLKLEDMSMFHEGLQANTGLPQCSYFSGLFVALKTSCPDVTAKDIVHGLYRYQQDFIELILRQWACYLLEYAQKNGILTAAKRLPDLWVNILNKLKNFQYYNIPSKQVQSAYIKLSEIEQIARFDVVIALQEIIALQEQL